MAKVEEALKSSPDQFKSQFAREKPSDNQEIIFHCKMGGRAQKASDKAVELGFKKLVKF